MASVRTFSIGLLLGLVVTAVFGLFKLSKDNGSMDLEYILANGMQILPESRIPIDIPLTGIAPLDNYLAFMAGVFWVVLNPKNYNGHLQSTHFLGTLMGAWVLMLLEAHRGGRPGLFILATYAFEFLGELIGVGSTTPMWCILHLVLTAVPEVRNKASLQKTLLAPPGHLAALGFAILLGQVVPTVLMILTKPDGHGLYSQQIWCLLRLCHPIFTGVLWSVFTIFTRPDDSPRPTPLWLRAANVRKVYLFTILASVVHHVLSFSIFLSEHWIPGWLHQDVVSIVSIPEAFAPFPFWTPGPVAKVSFVEGVMIFLQWDEALTTAAILIWAATLYIETTNKTSTVSGISRISSALQTVVVGVLAGPAAGAAFLLLERDNAALAYVEQVDITKQ